MYAFTAPRPLLVGWLMMISALLVLSTCKKEEEPPLNDLPVECTVTADEQLVIDDLNAQFAHPFAGADPEVADEQLMPLIDYLGNAKIVGMGEATHGTSEFFKMKDKLFRLLVTEKGFKAIIFEIPWGNSMVVDKYVTEGVGTADEVIDQTYYWVYDTEEVRQLAQWMHDYNQGLDDSEKIHFVGCDPQGGNFYAELNIITEYLSGVQPDSVGAVMAHYANLPYELHLYTQAEPWVHEFNRTATQAVFDYLEAHRDLFVELSGAFDFEVALMAAHVIQHREYIYRIGDSGTPRDSLMAIYTEWWQELLDAKVAAWAHNFHVMDGQTLYADWMGTYLRQRHPGYRIVGFSFGKGSFNAFLSGGNWQFLAPVRVQTIPTFPCRTVNHLLSMVDGDQHYLIFDELYGPSWQYFNAKQTFVQCGAGFNYDFIHNYERVVRWERLADVLIHFDETTESILK